MRRELTSRVVGRLAALALALCAPVGGSAAPDSAGQVWRNAIDSLSAAIDADRYARRSADELLHQAGLPLTAAPLDLIPLPPRAGSDVKVQRFDLRIAMGMLAQSFGHEDNSAVMEAQQAHGNAALMLDRGSLRLSDLAGLMRDDAIAGAGVLELRAPLILWKDAELRIEHDDLLRLSRSHGAFILNYGRLIIEGGEVQGVGSESPFNKEFQPFILTTGPGILQVRDARITDLGFGSTAKFSGLSVAGNALDIPASPSFVSDSVIARVRRVSVFSSRDTALHNNRIFDAGSAALVVAQSRAARITGNLISGRSETNAIRVIDGSAETLLEGNVILGGERVGILIKDGANNSELRNNLVWNREGSGIKIDRVRCVRISGNRLIGNRQKGIEIRRSLESTLIGNHLISNKSAGIWVSGQPKSAVTRIEDNILDGNGSGVATATAEVILLEGNDFSAQFPQFLAGDLVAMARFVATDMLGRAPIALDAAGPVQIADLPSHCDRGG